MIGVVVPWNGGTSGWQLRCGNIYNSGSTHTSYGCHFQITTAGIWKLMASSYLGHSYSSNHGSDHPGGVSWIYKLL